VSTLHALAAARETHVPGVRSAGLAGRGSAPRLRVYCSDQTHSSIDKAVILLGLGHESLRKIPSDAEFRCVPGPRGHRGDRAAGWLPMGGDLGTTSSTSVTLPEIAARARGEGSAHVDAAMPAWPPWCPARGPARRETPTAVVNPHKWLFTPFDLSAFYCRHMDLLRSAFSLVPEYLRTSDPSGVKNLMDTGVQLGRRFRSLKLWMILRYFGAEGVRTTLAEHMRLARLFAGWVDTEPGFERLAPTPFSVVCFRAVPSGIAAADLDAFNERLLEGVNASGDVFLSHTRLNGALALRLAVGQMRTAEANVSRAWQLLRQLAGQGRATAG
jgi:aromatic-L-amino-acid decarboxylase